MSSMNTRLSVHAALTGKRVLLTGATGFLGKAVLEKLIRTVPGIKGVVLPIRPGQHGDAGARFRREVAASSVFDTLRATRPGVLERFVDAQLECIDAELTAPRLGLSSAQHAALAGRIDAVIHAAASVDFREPLDAALAINADSVTHVAELARAAGAPLIHVSTCYVNGFNRGAMHEQPVHPARKGLGWDARGFYDVRPVLARLRRKIEAAASRCPDPDARRARLTDLGIAEAQRHGWNDTYTFTKWIGEQLALAALHGRSVTIVRPSIIESALQEPAPGWIEGVKVADAVILAYAHGKTRYFPGSAGKIIDIVPVDLVVNAVVLAAAEALQAPAAARIYQVCSGAANPITLGSVVELIKGAAQRDWHAHERLFARAPAHDFRLVSRPAFLSMLRLHRLGLGARDLVRRGAGRLTDTAASDALRTTEKLALTFSFYTAPRYVFHDMRLQALAQRFADAEQSQFPVDSRRIDWRDYLCNVHLAGLNRYMLRPRPAASSASAQAQPKPAPRTRMTRRDYAWLRMDGERNLMVINSVLLFAGPLDLQRLKSTVAQRLPNYPRFTEVVRTRWGVPYWVKDDAFDIDAHIEHLPLAGVANREARRRW